MNLHFAEKINIFMVFFLATLSLVPVIFANSIPGIAIILISFGMLNKDGLFIILGHLIGIFSIFVVWVMVIFGKILVFKIIDKYF
jgi:hypothetical protein